jgi:hypothetical protein
MRNSTCILLASVLCGSSVLGQTESDIRDRIVGTWKLVSSEQIMKDGSTRPDPRFGAHGEGFLMYQHDGYMCAYLVNPDLPKWADALHPTKEEKLAAADGMFSYCGRYEIDVKQNHIVHLPEVATDPRYVGSRQIRPYTFQDGHLILSDVEKDDSTFVRWKIVWEKAH